MYGGLIDRVHDLLLCGVDPSLVDLSMCLDHLKNNYSHAYRGTVALLRAASHHWTPSSHAFLYGPDFKACIASLCLVKVSFRKLVLLFFLIGLASQSLDLFFIRRIYVALRANRFLEEEAS